MGLIVRGIPVVIGLIIWNKTGNIIIGHGAGIGSERHVRRIERQRLKNTRKRQ